MQDYLKTVSPSVYNELSEILDKAIQLDEADMGDIQVYDERTQILHLITTKGFDEDFINHFREVKAFSASSCGRAIAVAAPVMISDIWNDTSSPEFKSAAKAAGYRAVKSVPIISKNKKLGVISTHFKDQKWTWNLNTLHGVVEELIPLLEKMCVDSAATSLSIL